MKKERLELLKEVYNEATEYDYFYTGLTITNADGMITNLFDYQYLEESGYLEIHQGENDKQYVVLTLKGVDLVEEMIELEEVVKTTAPTIIVMKSHGDVLGFNKFAKENDLPLYAIYKGQSIRGYNIKGQRPKMLIMHDEIENKSDREWLQKLVECMDQDYIALIN